MSRKKMAIARRTTGFGVLGGLIVWYWFIVPALPETAFEDLPPDGTELARQEKAIEFWNEADFSKFGDKGCTEPANPIASQFRAICVRQPCPVPSGCPLAGPSAQSQQKDDAAPPKPTFREARVVIGRRLGDNLDVYLTKASFETVSFPERLVWTGQTGEKWCAKLCWPDVVLTPALRVRDLTSGEILAQHTCFSNRTTVSPAP